MRVWSEVPTGGRSLLRHNPAHADGSRAPTGGPVPGFPPPVILKVLS